MANEVIRVLFAEIDLFRTTIPKIKIEERDAVVEHSGYLRFLQDTSYGSHIDQDGQYLFDEEGYSEYGYFTTYYFTTNLSMDREHIKKRLISLMSEQVNKHKETQMKALDENETLVTALSNAI